jgi:glycosyltransferase involved in cell wall biosynthesis
MLHGALVAAVVLGALGLALAVLNLALVPRLSRVPKAAAGGPLVSVVIPARNEERDVGAAIRGHLAQSDSNLEVVAVEDRSTDGTPAVLERLAREDPRVRVVSGVEPPPGWLGKPHALAEGAAAARGDLLLFADADVRYAPDVLARAVGFLERERLDFLCLLPRIEAKGFWENVLMPNLIVTFFTGPAFLIPRSGWRSIAAGGGAGNLVRRDPYHAAGGHEALRDSVIDDVRLGYLMKRSGHSIGVVRAEDGIAVRMYRGFGEIVHGFTKNAAYLFQGRAGVVLFLVMATTLALAILPAVVLLALAAGGAVGASDVRLASIALGLQVAMRLLLAGALGDPLWPSFTHPIMTAVWSGILARSLFQRFFLRRLTWRGRRFDARGARF